MKKITKIMRDKDLLFNIDDDFISEESIEFEEELTNELEDNNFEEEEEYIDNTEEEEEYDEEEEDENIDDTEEEEYNKEEEERVESLMFEDEKLSAELELEIEYTEENDIEDEDYEEEYEIIEDDYNDSLDLDDQELIEKETAILFEEEGEPEENVIDDFVDNVEDEEENTEEEDYEDDEEELQKEFLQLPDQNYETSMIEFVQDETDINSLLIINDENYMIVEHFLLDDIKFRKEDDKYIFDSDLEVLPEKENTLKVDLAAKENENIYYLITDESVFKVDFENKTIVETDPPDNDIEYVPITEVISKLAEL